MMQAVLEGIAFRVAEVLADMEKRVAILPTISIDGGMSRNPWFCQFITDVLGRQSASPAKQNSRRLAAVSSQRGEQEVKCPTGLQPGSSIHGRFRQSGRKPSTPRAKRHNYSADAEAPSYLLQVQSYRPPIMWGNDSDRPERSPRPAGLPVSRARRE